MKDLISGILSKDFSALAKAITLIENNSKKSKTLIDKLYPYRKLSQKIGITGPPGAGKSTLTSKIVKKYIEQNKTVGVICVDPSSSFNGGAILGDRIRMQDVYNHKNVFIRSLATRGSLGGLSNSMSDIEILLESSSFDVILYETVGVGQIELDIALYADTIVLVITPESGDDIQMMKSGLIEYASIIAINKSDRPGAFKMKAALEQAIELTHNPWVVPVVKTIATKEDNIVATLDAIDAHYVFLKTNNLIDKKNNQKYIKNIKNIAKDCFFKEVFTSKTIDLIDREISKPLNKRLSPYEIVRKIIK